MLQLLSVEGSTVGPQQHRDAGGDSAAAHDTNTGILDLAFAGLAAQLRDRLMDESHAVGAAV
jgi:hypothetical protein